MHTRTHECAYVYTRRREHAEQPRAHDACQTTFGDIEVACFNPALISLWYGHGHINHALPLISLWYGHGHINHAFPLISLWYSHGHINHAFPLISLWYSHGHINHAPPLHPYHCICVACSNLTQLTDHSHQLCATHCTPYHCSGLHNAPETMSLKLRPRPARADIWSAIEPAEAEPAEMCAVWNAGVEGLALDLTPAPFSVDVAIAHMVVHNSPTGTGTDKKMQMVVYGIAASWPAFACHGPHLCASIHLQGW
eukprot:363289-Chlamydomonas_euryale.AAC.4